MKQSDATGTLKKIEGAVYSLSKWLTILSMIAAMAMMFLLTADVTMRRAWNAPILGGLEVVDSMLVVLVFCAVAYVMSVKSHITVDTLTRLYPRRLRRVISGIALFLSLIIVALISYGTFTFGLEQLRVGEVTRILLIPIAPFILVVAFGSAVLFFVILAQFINILAGQEKDDGAS